MMTMKQIFIILGLFITVLSYSQVEGKYDYLEVEEELEYKGVLIEDWINDSTPASAINGANGLSKDGDNIILGGNPLNQNTEIEGAGYNFELGTSGSKLGDIIYYNGGDYRINSDGDLVLNIGGQSWIFDGNYFYNDATGDSLTKFDDVRDLISDATQTIPYNWGYTFDPTITDSRPGPGLFRLNNATYSSVTQLFIDNFDTDNVDKSDFISQPDTGTYITITDGTNYINYQLTGALTAASSYYKYGVTYVNNSGVISGLNTISLDLSNNVGGGGGISDSVWVAARADTFYIDYGEGSGNVGNVTNGGFDGMQVNSNSNVDMSINSGADALINATDRAALNGESIDIVATNGTLGIEVISGTNTYKFEDDTLFVEEEAIKAKYLESEISKTDTSIMGADTVTGFVDAQTAIEAIDFDSLMIKGYSIRFNESEGVHEFVTAKGGVVWQGPLEDLTLVYNNTGALIPNYRPVYFNGVNGDSIPTIDYAVASNPFKSLNVAGVTTMDIPNNDWGYVCNRGYVRNVDNSDLDITKPGFLGDSVIVDSTPPYPARVIVMGAPIYIDGTDGIFYTDVSAILEREFVSGETSYASGAIGVDYIYGFYDAPAADANLTLGTTVTLGSANIAYGAHAFAVTGGVGTVTGGGVVALVATGTVVTSLGTRTPGATDTLISDITTASLNDYYEALKFIGQVTYDLVVVSGSPSAATLDFNYGFAKYEDSFNRNFYVLGIECIGVGNATETGLDIELMHHRPEGWTYSATAFVPGNGVIASFATDYVVEKNLANGLPFSWKNLNVGDFIEGSGSEGLIVRVTTTTNNSVENMNTKIVIAVDRVAGFE